MNNHIHLIASAREKYNLSDILGNFIKFTSKAIMKEIELNPKESRRKWMLWLFREAGKKNGNNQTYQFWLQDKVGITEIDQIKTKNI